MFPFTKLKDNVEIYKRLVKDGPCKSHLRNKTAVIEALQDAIRKYHTFYTMENTGCSASEDSGEGW